MARFDGGWIKLYRGVVDGDICDRGGLTLATLVRLLVMANWKPNDAYFDGKRVKLQPGQLITGLRELSPDIEEDPYLHRIRGALQYLTERGTITQESSNRGRLITICNWDNYQGYDEGDSKLGASQAQSESNLTANRPQLSEEVKKGRRKKIGTNTEADASGSAPPASDANSWDGVHAEIRDPFTDPSVCHVSEAVQKGWLATFGEPTWIKHELKKAVLHLASNPRKVPKSPSGWARFFTTWMNRGWEWNAQRRPPPGGPPAGPLKTLADLEAEEARNAG